MAESDYNVADRVITSLEAGDKVQETVQATPDQDARDFAAAGGVSSAAYRNYATALNAHQSRTDIESLADRRTRENGTTFAAADFMRADVSDTPPTPGSVNGVAPASS
jgi:hypothetical protein